MLKKRDLVSVAVMLVIALVTFWVVLGDGQGAQAWAAVRLARWPWLVLGGLLMGCYTAAEALQIKLILRAMGRRAPYRHCCQVAAAGFYFSSVTPSATGGQPAQVFYLARRGVPAARGALTVLVFTIFHQLASVAWGLGAWLGWPELSAGLGAGFRVLLGCGLAATAVLTGGMTALLVWPAPMARVCRWGLRLGARLKLVRDLSGAERGLEEQMAEYAHGAALLRRRPLLPVWLLALALGQQGARFLIPWAVYRALGLTALGPLPLAATQALVSVAVGYLPIPGAVGASEAAFLSAFRAAFGSELTPAAMLLSRCLSFYLPVAVTALVTGFLHLSTRPRETAAAKNS